MLAERDRISKILARGLVPVSDRTLGDLFHRTADSLQCLYRLLLQRVAQATLVLADETPIQIMAKSKTKRGYVWTFRTVEIIVYVATASRSGATPAKVLGATKGTLLVDVYSGYNQVTTPQGRVRAGIRQRLTAIARR